LPVRANNSVNKPRLTPGNVARFVLSTRLGRDNREFPSRAAMLPADIYRLFVIYNIANFTAVIAA